MRTSLNRAALWPIPVLCMIGFFFSLAVASDASAKEGYLRTPDIHGSTIVFTAEGDLWSCTDAGEDVRRITTHVGDETGPRFSPDGKWIAFSGMYDGNTDIYVMPASGGEPKRITWHPGPDALLGWTPDGEKILFTSWRNSPHRSPYFFSVPLEGGDPEQLPIGYGRTLDVDPETGRYAFTRTRGGGTWKRYRGGTAADIWIGDPKQADFQNVTEFEGADTSPMWHGGRVYYLCDRGGAMNIWSMLPDGSDRKRHTSFDKWDARESANDGSGRIVFTLAGDIHLFDPAAGVERIVPVDLPSELILTRNRYPDPSGYVSGFALAPEGDRVAVVARGEIFSIPVEDGITLSITKGSGAREKHVSYDSEGERVIYISDESGEEKIITADAWGRGETDELKIHALSNWLFPPVWSPDDKKVAYSDNTHTLYVADADGGNPIKVDRGGELEIREYTWSPDSRWLAYAKDNEIEIGAIFIFDTKDKSTHPITDFASNDYTPSWDPDGRYLYFLSDRVVNPYFGNRDFETITMNSTIPCMVLLRPDVENPFLETEGLPPDDEDEEEDEEADDEAEDEKKIDPVEINFDRIAGRILELPVDPGNLSNLQATSSKVFYESYPSVGQRPAGGSKGPRGTLMAFDFEEKEASEFLSGISHYELQPGAGKMIVQKEKGDLYVVEAGAPPGDLSDSHLSFENVVIDLDPRDEWRQMFYEGWRNLRDFYWDAGMHGVDWESVRDQYATLLPRLANRADFSDLMREMIGELATSHTYIWGGDPAVRPPKRSNGLLGAELVREGNAYKVEKILWGGSVDRVRSCLAEPGVDVKEGDYILAVNRVPFSAERPFWTSLDDLAGHNVLLTVNDRNSGKGAREVVVRPMSQGEETSLRYADWVRRNREYVAKETDGKIGYIHIPDMGIRGLYLFNRWFYPQLNKEGMVVDMRWNGGGFVSQLIVSRLLRDPIMWGRSRGGSVWPYPDKLLNGPIVVLTNEFAGSDGDIGPNAIQLTKLAPVIGQRSWGGVIGIRSNKPLVDGGMETQPEFAHWDKEHGWGLENRGVEPDIEVINLPQELGKNVDSQLDRGIVEIMKLHRLHPPFVPDFEPAPDQSRSAYTGE